MSLADNKQLKKMSAQELANWRINEFYQPYKQRNIDGGRRGYTAQDKKTMDAFIDAVGDACDAYETAINAAADQSALDAITIDYSSIAP